jgi:hypothetical protein
VGRVYSGLQSGLDITNPRDRDRLIRYGYFGISALRRGVVIHDSTSPIVSCASAKGGFIVGFSSSSFSSYKIPQVSSCKVSHTVPTDILCYKVNLQLNSYTMRRDECKLSLIKPIPVSYPVSGRMCCQLEVDALLLPPAIMWLSVRRDEPK